MLIMVILPLIINLVITEAGYFTPEQFRLSWTNSSDEMRVTWSVYLPIPSKLYFREILCDSNISEFTSIKSSSYAFNGGLFGMGAQYIHSVIVPVRKTCVYEYYAGSWMGWTPIYRFSGRSPSKNDLLLTDIIILADWGGGSQGLFTRDLLVKQMTLNKFDAILHAGDIAYNLDGLGGMVGDSWLYMVEPISSRMPYMVLPGNNEKNDNYTHYKNRFIMPYNEANQGSGYFYSFDLGRAHYIMINTDIYLDSSKYDEVITQNNWLEKDLRKAVSERNERPWIIVLTHRNMYCSINWKTGLDKNEECGAHAAGVRSHLEEMMKKYQVDLFFQGHIHLYARYYPVYKNVTFKDGMINKNMFTNPRAPIYITNGNAGNIQGNNIPSSDKKQDWVVFQSSNYGYGRLLIFNQSHLYYEQYASKKKRVIDYLWVIKK